MTDLATLQKMHPDWNLVDAIEGPQGQGIIALGRDGGVFALDAQGGTTGLVAPLAFAGGGAFSYTTLAPEQRQAGVGFAKGGITQNQFGGYTLTNVNQQNYEFRAPPPPQPTQAGTTSTAGTQQATDTTPTSGAGDVTGSAAIHAVLDPLGLGSLADTALAALHGTKGADASWITTVWLPQQHEYTDAFPEIAAAQAKNASGTPTHIPTPAEITTYHQGVQGLVDQGLLPPEFATRDKVSGLINGGVSLPEFQNRVLSGVDKFMNADPADQQAFMAYHPGMTLAHAVGALLDPTLGEAAVNRMITQATIGGSAIRSGFGSISAGQATALEQAGQGSTAQFTQAALQHPLTEANVGESSDVTRQTQLGAMGGSATDQAAINRRLAGRQAQFQGGGGAGGQGGRGGTGLGASTP